MFSTSTRSAPKARQRPRIAMRGRRRPRRRLPGRHQPVRNAATGDGRHLEPELAEGQAHLPASTKRRPAAEAVGTTPRCQSREAHERTVAVGGVRQDVTAGPPWSLLPCDGGARL